VQRDTSHWGARGIYWAPADGTGKEELLVAGSNIFPDSWTPDGKTLLYESMAPARIWMVSMSAPAGDSRPRMLSEPSPFNEAQAQVSPDGRWMAYVSDESGKSQENARPFPGPGSKVPISIEAGDTPRWSANGREIFYFDPNKNQVMAVAIEGGHNVHRGAVWSDQIWIRIGCAGAVAHAAYNLTLYAASGLLKMLGLAPQ
jgi:Tol biopolymer transport system component